MITVPWKVTGGRDLHAELHCGCPMKRYIGTDLEHIMKTSIQLCGYADNYFFDYVNAFPRDSQCPECGRKFTQRWVDYGLVQIVWKEETP